jgi:uncharacterized protein DUF3313
MDRTTRFLDARTPIMRRNQSTIVTAFLLAGVLAACSATKEGNAKDVRFSGFLGDYSQLQKGGGERPDYVYVKPGLDLSAYKRVMIDPPQAWVSEAQRKKMGEKNLSYILTSLDKALRDDIGKKWELVDRPAPDVIRIRMAISNASGENGTLTPFTRIVPWGLMVSEGVDATTGNYINNGRVTGELEVQDGGTGARLAAAVDERVGANSISNAFSNWGDVVDGCRFWAERVTSRLVKYKMKPTK